MFGVNPTIAISKTEFYNDRKEAIDQKDFSKREFDEREIKIG